MATLVLPGAYNPVANGLLLRGDLHTLFDLGLIATDSTSMAVLLAPPLLQSTYADLRHATLRVPEEVSLRPGEKAIDHHRAWSGL